MRNKSWVFVGVVISILTLVVLSVQVLIIYRQTEILERSSISPTSPNAL